MKCFVKLKTTGGTIYVLDSETFQVNDATVSLEQKLN